MQAKQIQIQAKQIQIQAQQIQIQAQQIQIQQIQIQIQAKQIQVQYLFANLNHHLRRLLSVTMGTVIKRMKNAQLGGNGKGNGKGKGKGNILVLNRFVFKPMI